MSTSISFCSHNITNQYPNFLSQKLLEGSPTSIQSINNRDVESPSLDLSISQQKKKLINYSKKYSYKYHLLCPKCQDKMNESINDYIISRKTLKMVHVINMMFPSDINTLSQSILDSSVKRTRKMDRDCIHKKIKCRLFKYIKTTIKELMEDKYSFLRIPQNVICDATFKFNNWLLNTSVMNIFVEKDLYFSNYEQIASFAKKGKENSLINFLNQKVSDVFENYLKSSVYEKDLIKFHNDEYLKIFKYYCDGFIEYYNKIN